MASRKHVHTLTFLHQDGKMVFPVEWALFVVEDGKLTFSLQCRDANDWPVEPLFCVVDLPVDGALHDKLILTHDRNQTEWRKRRRGGGTIPVFVGPHAHLYTGPHYEPYKMTIKFRRVTPKWCEVGLEFMMPDVRRYDRRARDHPVKGHFVMKRGTREQMWMPD